MLDCEKFYRESVSGVQMVQMLVNQAGVFLQQVGVQHLHDETDSVSVQLRAQVLWKQVRGCGGQQVSAGCCVSTTASCVQGLPEFIGVGWLEVNGDILSSEALFRNSCCFIITFNLGKQIIRGDKGGLRVERHVGGFDGDVLKRRKGQKGENQSLLHVKERVQL